MIPKDGIPILKGFIKGDQIFVWCPYCRKFHSHGAPQMWGHRVAHCVNENSPFLESGYYIQPFTKTDIKKYYPKIKYAPTP